MRLEEYIADMEEWELDQCLHATESLVRGYAEIELPTKRQASKLRRYQREVELLTAEIANRRLYKQLVLDLDHTS